MEYLAISSYHSPCDHLAQFFIIPKKLSPKRNINDMYTYYMKNFNEEKFMDDVKIVERTVKKVIERTQDPNIST